MCVWTVYVLYLLSDSIEEDEVREEKVKVKVKVWEREWEWEWEWEWEKVGLEEKVEVKRVLEDKL